MVRQLPGPRELFPEAPQLEAPQLEAPQQEVPQVPRQAGQQQELQPVRRPVAPHREAPRRAVQPELRLEELRRRVPQQRRRHRHRTYESCQVTRRSLKSLRGIVFQASPDTMST